MLSRLVSRDLTYEPSLGLNHAEFFLGQTSDHLISFVQRRIFLQAQRPRIYIYLKMASTG